MEEGKEPALVAGEKKAGASNKLNTDGTFNLFLGISACTKVRDLAKNVQDSLARY
jgi:hypothetical protein